MAALDRIQVSSSLGISPLLVRQYASKAIWDWYDEHKRDKILEVRVWFFTKTFYIEDLTRLPLAGNLIERIAGKRPFPK